MHNGTVPYFKQIKRSMISRISERAFQLIQGTTDSEMMLAMFITNFEKLAGLNEDSNAYHQEPGDGMDDPYPYVKNKEDYTQHLADALKQTLRQVLPSVINTRESKKITSQVHYIVLEHEYKSGVQPRPTDQEHIELDTDGASVSDPLPPTRAIGRLNLAVTDGQSTCTSRYLQPPIISSTGILDTTKIC